MLEREVDKGQPYNPYALSLVVVVVLAVLLLLLRTSAHVRAIIKHGTITNVRRTGFAEDKQHKERHRTICAIVLSECVFLSWADL